MHKLLKEFNTSLPLNDIFPWKGKMEFTDNFEFRNVHHFVQVVKNLSQHQDNYCGVSYKQAVKDLIAKKPMITPEKQESIRNLVRSNLHKRGLITEEIYEAFKYATEGTQVGIDVGKYAAGEPDCVITPTKKYIDLFYELFINISYPYYVKNEDIMKNMAKLLATVEELERQHIFIKITLVFPATGVSGSKSMFLSIPLFSHKEFKDIGVMSSVLNDRLLRKFMFAILENFYGNTLAPGYGTATTIDKTMNLGKEFKEVEFFESVKFEVGA